MEAGAFDKMSMDLNSKVIQNVDKGLLFNASIGF